MFVKVGDQFLDDDTQPGQFVRRKPLRVAEGSCRDNASATAPCRAGGG